MTKRLRDLIENTRLVPQLCRSSRVVLGVLVRLAQLRMRGEFSHLGRGEEPFDHGVSFKSTPSVAASRRPRLTLQLVMIECQPSA